MTKHIGFGRDYEDETKDNSKSNINLSDYPGVEAFIKNHKPAEKINEAIYTYSTNELLLACNDIVYSEQLTSDVLYKLLKQNNYIIIDVGQHQRWIFK